MGSSSLETELLTQISITLYICPFIFWQICSLLWVVIQPLICSCYLSRLIDSELQVQQWCTGAANWLSFSFWIQSKIKPRSLTGACAAHKSSKWEIIRVRCCTSWSFGWASFLFLAPLKVLRAPGASMLGFPKWMYAVPCIAFQSILSEVIYRLWQHDLFQLFQGNVSILAMLSPPEDRRHRRTSIYR